MKTPILPEVVVTGKRRKKSTVTPPPIKDAINQAFTLQFMNESGLFDDYDDDDMMKYLYSNLLLGNKMKMPAFKDGKDKKTLSSESVYREIMKDVARENYKNWGYSSAQEAWEDQINNPTYDYRGYYSDPEYQNSDANADIHWPDAYKTPKHKTFSSDSKYSGKVSEKNPYGLRGGVWVGDKFIPAAWLRHINLPEYKDGKDEYDTEVYLPNIDVYPDPELRRNVVYTWPDLNTRRNVLNTINDYKTTVENGLPYYTASGKNVAYRSGALLPANLEVERAVNLVREAGYPETIFESRYNNDGSKFRDYIAVHKEKQSGFFKNFFNWLGGIFGKRPVNQSTIHAGSSPFESRTGYFAELPHAYQYAKGLDKYGKLVNTNTPFFVKDSRSVEEKSADALRYNDPTNIEYLAHKIIEPYMYMYMRGGENASIDDFNSGVEDRLLYNLKTHRGAL